MNSTPYRRCSFCRRDHYPTSGKNFDRRAWTWHPTSGVFTCPDCRHKGEEAERLAIHQHLQELNHINNVA